MKYIPAIVIVVSMAGTASAGPVLLGSFDRINGSGSTGISDPRAQVGIRFRERESPSDPIELSTIVFADMFLNDGDSGVFVFRPETHSAIDPIAVLAANGIDDFINLFTIWPDFGQIGIRGDTESFFFERDILAGQPPDFVGYELDFIRLVIRSVNIEPLTIQGLDGYQATFDYTYEFYGTPIPDPGTLVFLVSAGMIKLMGRHMR